MDKEKFIETSRLEAPDKKTQWILAGMQLDYLIKSAKSGNPDAKWELKQRYAPCVYNIDEPIDMHPHYLHSREWQTAYNEHNVSTRHRECVTYECPHSPTPECYDYDDRISAHYDKEDIEIAYQLANKQTYLSGKRATARWWEIYLSSLKKKPIQVNRIITGIQTDGYPWNAIGQSEIKPTNQIMQTSKKIRSILDTPKKTKTK